MTDATLNASSASPRPASPSRAGAGTHAFVLLCIALVGCFFAWAALAELDVVSNATGEVVPASQIKSVQHLEGGIVSEILVAEGERVEEGEPLMVLESAENDADAGELRLRLMGHEADIARLKAELSGLDAPRYPPSLMTEGRDLVREATEMFVTRKNRLDFDLAAQHQAITQREQEIKEVEARLSNNKKTLGLVNEQVGISDQLLKRNLTNRMVHLDLVKEAATLRGRIEEDSAMLPRTKAALAEAQAKLEAIRSQFREEAQEELDDALRAYSELTQRLTKFEDSLRRSVLRSPVSGTVKSIYVVTVGGVVSPGGTVMDIVPGEDRLVIQAKLPPQDIGYVRTGQRAAIKLASADAVRFGSIEGVVESVSPDTLVGEKEQPFYRVRLATQSTAFERNGEAYELFPGMQVICSIETGRRTILEYLIEPWVGRADEALRER